MVRLRLPYNRLLMSQGKHRSLPVIPTLAWPDLIQACSWTPSVLDEEEARSPAAERLNDSTTAADRIRLHHKADMARINVKYLRPRTVSYQALTDVEGRGPGQIPVNSRTHRYKYYDYQLPKLLHSDTTSMYNYSSYEK